MVYDSELSEEAKQIIGEAENESNGRITDSINKNEKTNEETNKNKNVFDKRTVIKAIRSRRDSMIDYGIGYLKNITNGEYSEEAYEEVADHYVDKTINDIKKLDMSELSQVSDEIEKFAGDYIVGKKYEKLANAGQETAIQRYKKYCKKATIFIGTYTVGSVSGASTLVAVGAPLSLGAIFALGGMAASLGKYFNLF